MKVPIQNLYYLLCFAWEYLPQELALDVGAIPASADVLDLCSYVLVNGMEHLFRRGLDQGYFVRQERTSRLRGRINITLTVRHQAWSRPEAVCQFDELDHLLEERVFASSVAQLLGMLRDLEIVEREFRKKQSEKVPILPPRNAADFEQLLIDILNEDHQRARHAPLIEDLLEKTDFRVHTQGVNRKRGARVQATMATDPFIYQNKLARIDRLEEIIILSPASIVRFVNETGIDIGLPLSSGSGGVLLKEAGLIRDSLFSALDRRYQSPLGPLTSVPQSLREAIRRFIAVEATRSTNVLRDREVREGKISTWRG